MVPTSSFTILPWLSLSFSFNIVSTALIIARILLYRKQVFLAFGPGHVSPYTSLMALIVESAALNSTFWLIYIVLYALKYPLDNLVLQVLCPVQVRIVFYSVRSSAEP